MGNFCNSEADTSKEVNIAADKSSNSHSRMEQIYQNYFEPKAHRQIICVGRNYAAHIQELGNVAPKEPLWFDKPMSSVLLPGENFQWHPSFKDIHYEVELGVVIGKRCKSVSEEDCMSYISGYFLGVDFTNRTLQDS